jgi:hypothetical protein
MKQFTVKDFITYNAPCFSCGESIILEFGSVELINNGKVSGQSPVFLKPIVSKDRTEISLKISYVGSLQLWIFHKSNKFLTTNFTGLSEYLNTHKLFLRSRCNKCNSLIDSQFIEFNLKSGFIKPVGISAEYLSIQDKSHLYCIHSKFLDDKTIIIADRIDKTTPVSGVRIEIPLLPLYKFKDKEKIISKIKTYILFS